MINLQGIEMILVFGRSQRQMWDLEDKIKKNAKKVVRGSYY